MGRQSTVLKGIAQGVFYLTILALIVSDSVSAGISHDENQFIAPGQLLAYHGLVPYVDYPYTHMPYATIFYAFSALASDFDFLAGRLLSCLAWLGCILLIVAISRALRGGINAPARSETSWKQLLWEFALVYVLVNHGPVLFILRTALNHSLATLFALLAAWFLVRGMRLQATAPRAAFFNGACIAAAGLTRFNFASLGVVFLVCWLIYALWLGLARTRSVIMRYLTGGLIASVPVIVLMALAPRAFYYSNLVYIRLNTVYYEQLLRRSGMDLASKLHDFVYGILVQPLDLLLYALLLYTAATSIVHLLKRRSALDLARLGIAGTAFTLWLTALAPTPGLLQYFAAPVPFLFVLLLAVEVHTVRFDKPVRALGVLLVLVAAATSIRLTNPADEFAVLAKSSKWIPVELHQLARQLQNHVRAEGRILTLQPMIPLEAGYDIYSFTAAGPFNWRTSLLLTPERRREYGVTSPQELPALLADSPPDAILTGFEAPNAGFERQQLGGLETPFSDYALGHSYEAVALSPPFWSRGLTLWIRP